SVRKLPCCKGPPSFGSKKNRISSCSSVYSSLWMFGSAPQTGRFQFWRGTTVNQATTSTALALTSGATPSNYGQSLTLHGHSFTAVQRYSDRHSYVFRWNKLAWNGNICRSRFLDF